MILYLQVLSSSHTIEVILSIGIKQGRQLTLILRCGALIALDYLPSKPITFSGPKYEESIVWKRLMIVILMPF